MQYGLNNNLGSANAPKTNKTQNSSKVNKNNNNYLGHFVKMISQIAPAVENLSTGQVGEAKYKKE